MTKVYIVEKAYWIEDYYHIWEIAGVCTSKKKPKRQ